MDFQRSCELVSAPRVLSGGFPSLVVRPAGDDAWSLLYPPYRWLLCFGCGRCLFGFTLVFEVSYVL